MATAITTRQAKQISSRRGYVDLQAELAELCDWDHYAKEPPPVTITGAYLDRAQELVDAEAAPASEQEIRSSVAAVLAMYSQNAAPEVFELRGAVFADVLTANGLTRAELRRACAKWLADPTERFPPHPGGLLGKVRPFKEVNGNAVWLEFTSFEMNVERKITIARNWLENGTWKSRAQIEEEERQKEAFRAHQERLEDEARQRREAREREEEEARQLARDVDKAARDRLEASKAEKKRRDEEEAKKHAEGAARYDRRMAELLAKKDEVPF